METNITVKNLPDSEQPYEKFLISGVESLSDAELIAVIIRSGTRGTRSVIKSGTNGVQSIDVARNFLTTGRRNLLNLYDVSYEDMIKIRGIGKVKAIQLKCIAELSRRITETK